MIERAVDTWRALWVPRRALATMGVAIPLIASQWYFTPSPAAIVSGGGMVVAFLLTAPVGWRGLFPLRGWRGHFVLRVVGYLSLGIGVVGLFGVVLPSWMELPTSLMTSGPNLVVALGFYWVGGWGLGRDIDLEHSLRRARERAEVLAHERERAELLALRHHLDPHFLFNTLNAIAEWCREDPRVAEEALLELASLLRTMLSGVRAEEWPLATELEMVERLFVLYRTRDPERFRVRWEGLDEVPRCLVPPMLSLPLAENAMTHGPAAGHRGVVRSAIQSEGGRVRWVLENPGPYGGLREGGEGVDMVRRRLALAYGEEASLVIEGVGDRTRAILEWPIREGE